jgi:5,10-methylene-tetrahydrofolate dehydrogenase/methenyl tetrahydrofolate cyclohydrolase
VLVDEGDAVGQYLYQMLPRQRKFVQIVHEGAAFTRCAATPTLDI